jgi:hypothetical protein
MRRSFRLWRWLPEGVALLSRIPIRVDARKLSDLLLTEHIKIVGDFAD